MKVLLTSAGLETENIKALFIPTAAIDAGAIGVLPKCINDLLKCEIQDSNITVYDLHKKMSLEQLKQFNVVYICGGNTEYLLERINEQGFNELLIEYIKSDGILLGVSAGSIIAAKNLENNLGLINCQLHVHSHKGNVAGKLNISCCNEVSLTDNQAIYLTDIDYGEIIE